MVGQTKANASKVRFDERGLAPCVVQDSRTGEVLMVAYVNEEALELTLETGQMHLYSRSRDQIWHKGGTSGNFQRVTQLRYDCDGDAGELENGVHAGDSCPTGRPGVCAQGGRSCSNGAVICLEITAASGEKCNDLDDDCDGAVDNGC